MPDIPLQTTMKVSALDAKHPDYILYKQAWEDISLLYQGGTVLRKRAENFLTKRPKELAEVYAQRIQRFTYQNILGSTLGWYSTAMFRDDPDIAVRANDPDIEDEFYTAWLADCDRAGTTFVDFFRRVILTCWQFQSALVLIDLPKPGDEAPAPSSLADQKARGGLDPYLVLYDPRAAINWEVDQYGNLEWIVLAVTTEERIFGQGRKIVDRWYYFDRAQYAVYKAERKESNENQQINLSNPDAVIIDSERPTYATLEDSGPHALSNEGRVPIQWIQVPDGLWLGNRVYLPLLSHLNLQNALHWQMLMACLPVLWVKGEFKTPPVVSETGYLEIAADGDIGYVEPSGTSVELTAKELNTLREEIYRQMYLQAQGRSSSASASAASGYSKEMDMAPSQDILNGYGDILRAGMGAVLQDVAAIRGDKDKQFEVRGFTFDDSDEAEEIATAQEARDMDIQSDTLDKEIQKNIARSLLKDASPDLVKTVEKEIEAAPTKSELAAQQKAEQQQQMANALGAGIQKFQTRSASAAL